MTSVCPQFVKQGVHVGRLLPLLPQTKVREEMSEEASPTRHPAFKKGGGKLGKFSSWPLR